MKDFYFYTLSASFVAISIAVAMMQSTGPKVSDECIVENGYIVQDKKLENLTSSPGTNFTFVAFYTVFSSIHYSFITCT
jgi:hypothetical protein